jgi:sulfotransferase
MQNSKNNLGKKYHFIAGLPRSGSTLLCNILAQNPRFHTTSTSGIMDVIFGVRNQWDNLIEFKASPNPEGKLRVLRGILDNYYSDTDKPIVFDKCRGWLSLLEMAEEILGHKAKVIVPVRDIREILSSFEKLWRKSAGLSQHRAEASNYFQFQTVRGRTDFWLQGDQVLGLAYNRITDAIQRGFSDRMLLVDFDDMTQDPKRVFNSIYKFLDEEPFEHDFNNVKQVTWEDDSIHGFKGLHDIRSKVEPLSTSWPSILGPFADKYKDMNFWKKQG